MSLRILVADKFEKSGLEGLKALGCEVISEPDAGVDGIPAALERTKPQILVVRSTKVPAASIDKCAGVAAIIRAGAGVDNIDVKAATAKGIKVCNCPGMNAVAVAELTMGLLIACDRRIVDQTVMAREGKWNKKEFGKTGTGGAKGLKSSTLGVIGAGAIGRAVVKRALAFDMRVIIWSRSITKEHARDLGAEWGGTDTPSLLALAAQCDAVTVHLPLAPDTKGLIGADFISKLKPGAIVLNTSRGGVIDEAALRDGIATKGLRAGLDVFSEQPSGTEGPWESVTAKMTGVTATHHSGASTNQSQEAIAAEVVRMVKVFQATGKIENTVN
ncbi:MAG: hydroxyacid dehydrogenase [Planctomycetes bacterium]|nr:hydroxyacid dehydrogenase [Planctomycetota bacterium]